MIFGVLVIGCAGSKQAPSIDREPANAQPRGTSGALAAGAPHGKEVTPKRETAPTSSADKNATKGEPPETPKETVKDTESHVSKDAVEPAPASDGTCPAGMKLVDGDYCTDVDYECKKSWYDKSNKKTVCEEFAAKSTCVGAKVHKRYCMDTYTWPNEKGARPEVMNRFNQAEVKCAAVG
ncbi:MAG: hypothetical protein ABIQ16_11905 [Polyangiaceae bacterium]